MAFKMKGFPEHQVKSSPIKITTDDNSRLKKAAKSIWDFGKKSRSWVNKKTGVTKVAIQCVADVDDDEPSVSGTTQTGVLMQGRSTNTASSASHPKLVVNHGADPFVPSTRFF